MLGPVGAFSVFFALIEVIILGASSAGIPVKPVFAFFTVVLALAGAVFYLTRFYRGQRRFFSRSRLPWWTAALLLVTLALYLLLWVMAYALPDFSYDGNYYHSPTIHFWMLEERVHWITCGGSEHWGPIVAYAWNGYPKAVELIGFTFLQGGLGARLLNSVNLFFLPLGAMSVAAIALNLGAGTGYALVAGCLFLFMPINLSQSLTAMVDTASSSCYLAFFAFLLGSAKRIRERNVPWIFLPGLGASLGLAAGSKFPGLMLVPAGCLVLLVRAFLARRNGEREKTGPSGLGRTLAFILLTALIGMLVGGFWIGRNWARTGNPLYPAEIKLGGVEVFPGEDISTQFRPPYPKGRKEWSQTARVLANWVGCLRLLDEENYAYDSRRGGLGWAWLLSLPAVFWLLFSLPKKKKSGRYPPGSSYLPDLFFVCLVMFFAMPRYHNHMSRYTIWLAGLGFPCLAVVAGRMAGSPGNSRWKRVVGKAWLGAVCLLGVLEAGVGLRIHSSFIRTFRGREPKACPAAEIAEGISKPYPAGYRWTEFNGSVFEMIMADRHPAAVAIMDKNQRHLIFGHLVQGPALGKREIVFIDHRRAEEERGYLKGLIQDNAVRYVIWDSRLPLYGELVNRSVRQDYELGEKFWNVFTFNTSGVE